jgi:hypothetical protein
MFMRVDATWIQKGAAHEGPHHTPLRREPESLPTTDATSTSAISKTCTGAFPETPPPSELPDDLIQLIRLWSNLPEAIRATIFHLANCLIETVSAADLTTTKMVAPVSDSDT